MFEIKMTPEVRKLTELCDQPEMKTDQLGAQKVRAGGYPVYYAVAWVHALAIGIDCERAAKTPRVQAAAVAAFKSIAPQISILAQDEPRLLHFLPRVNNILAGKDFHAPILRRSAVPAKK